MYDARVTTIVIGAGPAGLAAAAMLQRSGDDVVVLERGDVGDAWRSRYDRLHLHTVRWLSCLPGYRMPRSFGKWPSRDGVVEYLERYVERRALDVRTGVDVQTLDRDDRGWNLGTSNGGFAAARVVVATGHSNVPFVPRWPGELDGEVVHSASYRNPAPFRGRRVVVVGSGNSGAEIAVELAATRRAYLSGPDVGHAPIWAIHNRLSLWLADHLLTVNTRLGRKMRDTRKRRGDPLVRLKPTDILAAGVQRVPRVGGIVDGMPQLADGQLLEVAVVVWATGYRADFGWIDLPIFDDAGNPIHHRGVVAAAPGLYFLGLPFQYTPTSDHVGGVGRDARHIVQHLAAHVGRSGVVAEPGHGALQQGR